MADTVVNGSCLPASFKCLGDSFFVIAISINIEALSIGSNAMNAETLENFQHVLQQLTGSSRRHEHSRVKAEHFTIMMSSLTPGASFMSVHVILLTTLASIFAIHVISHAVFNVVDEVAVRRRN